MDYHIYFHDDFDGMASAAVMVNFLESRGDSVISFNGINYDPNLKPKWASFDFERPFILLDFLYHPDASWWFDHHPTSFIDPKWQAEFKNDLNHVFDPTIKSACELVLEHLKNNHSYKPPAFIEDLTIWATKIDSADYQSAEEALFGKEPAIKLARATNPINFENGNSDKYFEMIIRGLAGGPVSEVIEIPAVSEEIERVEKENSEVGKIFKDISVVTGKVVFVDGSKTKIQLSGYFSYYFYPEIEFAVTLEFYSGYYHLNVGKNLWKKTGSKIHIGELLKKYGGGGHKTVGGVEKETKPEILKIVEEVIQYLNDNP